jgi:hypothetical protein
MVLCPQIFPQIFHSLLFSSQLVIAGEEFAVSLAPFQRTGLSRTDNLTLAGSRRSGYGLIRQKYFKRKSTRTSEGVGA